RLGRAGARGPRDVMRRRQYSEADRAHRDADRVEHAADRAAYHRRAERGIEQVIFDALPDRVGLVRLDALVALAVPRREEPRRQMMERAERADPAAEDAPEHERQREDAERP